jgi:hypothetical protein
MTTEIVAVAQAANFLAVSPSTVRRLVPSGGWGWIWPRLRRRCGRCRRRGRDRLVVSRQQSRPWAHSGHNLGTNCVALRYAPLRIFAARWQDNRPTSVANNSSILTGAPRKRSSRPAPLARGANWAGRRGWLGHGRRNACRTARQPRPTAERRLRQRPSQFAAGLGKRSCQSSQRRQAARIVYRRRVCTRCKLDHSPREMDPCLPKHCEQFWSG